MSDGAQGIAPSDVIHKRYDTAYAAVEDYRSRWHADHNDTGIPAEAIVEYMDHPDFRVVAERAKTIARLAHDLAEAARLEGVGDIAGAEAKRIDVLHEYC